MAYKAFQVSVTNNAGGTKVIDSTVYGMRQDQNVGEGRTLVFVQNPSTNAQSVFFGGVDVDVTTKGFPVAPGETLIVGELGPGDDLWARSAGGGAQTVNVFVGY